MSNYTSPFYVDVITYPSYNLIAGAGASDHISRDRFYQLGLTLMSAWISNQMRSNEWDIITYPSPNFNGTAVEVWGSISNFIPYFITRVSNYMAMLVFELVHVIRKGHWL